MYKLQRILAFICSFFWSLKCMWCVSTLSPFILSKPVLFCVFYFQSAGSLSAFVTGFSFNCNILKLSTTHQDHFLLSLRFPTAVSGSLLLGKDAMHSAAFATCQWHKKGKSCMNGPDRFPQSMGELDPPVPVTQNLFSFCNWLNFPHICHDIFSNVSSHDTWASLFCGFSAWETPLNHVTAYDLCTAEGEWIGAS